MWTRFLIWTAFVAAAAAAPPLGTEASNIITNGYPAQVGKAPYIVGLLLKEGVMGRWCGGSIIDHNWVLTAAHCTDHIDSVTIYYGATRRTQPLFQLTVDVQHVVQHPEWPDSIGNDIALIRTPHVGFWSLVNKVELPSLQERSRSYESSLAVTCGWGSTYDGSQLPDWLQCVDLHIISNEQCESSYGSLPDSVLCVETPDGRSICDGDSGGPLVTHDSPKLVGITSFSDAESCHSEAPAGFTRVTAHLDWIHKVSGVVY